MQRIQVFYEGADEYVIKEIGGDLIDWEIDRDGSATVTTYQGKDQTGKYWFKRPIAIHHTIRKQDA